MKLDEFISNVLHDIDKGLQNAKTSTGRKYHIQASNNNGVSFDIAVTTTTSSGSEAKGNAKAGIIQVLGADVGAKLDSKKENSEASRIQFTVYVPTMTENESQEEIRRVQAMNERQRDEYSF